MGVPSWSRTADLNAVADPAIQASDGASTRSISESLRGVMASVRRQADVMGGALVTAGTANAYTIDGADLTELRPGLALVMRADRTNTDEPTLSVDGFGPLPLLDATGASLPAGRIIGGRFYFVLLDPDAPAWRIQAGHLGVVGTVPAGLLADYSLANLTRVVSSDEGVPNSYVIRADLTAPKTAIADPRRRLELIGHGGQGLAAAGGASVLALGSRASTTSAPYSHRALMANTGTLQNSSTALDPRSISDLWPAQEDATKGESQGTSMMRKLITDQLAAGRDPDNYAYWTHAYDGRRVAELSKGTVFYGNGLTVLRRIAFLARLYGCPGLVMRTSPFTQGEADRVAPQTSRASYSAALIQYARDWQSDVRAITRQAEPIWITVDQLSGSDTGIAGPSQIALGQLDAIETDPAATGAYITGACPKYFLQGGYGYVDNVHLKPPGYALLGEYHAKARQLVRAAFEANSTVTRVETCLRPNRAAITRSAALITVPLLGAVGGLSIDTTTLPQVPGYGFTYSGAAITSVTISGNSLVITLASAVPGTLAYAMDVQNNADQDRSCAWGNVRDNCAEASSAVPGLNLRNWLVHFDAAVA